MSNPRKNKSDPVVNALKAQVEQLKSELVTNISTIRGDLFRQLLDPRRDLNRECGYPRNLDPWQYQLLYERNYAATRVVEVMPKEAHQVQFEVYEKEKGGTTAFEEAWDSLGSQINQTKSWFADSEGSTINELLLRADIQCGIGQYGVILLGLNDGLDMSLPVDGVEEKYSMPGLVGDSGLDGSAGAAASPNGPNGDLGQNLTKNAGTDEQFAKAYGASAPPINWTPPEHYMTAVYDKDGLTTNAGIVNNVVTVARNTDGSVPTPTGRYELSTSSGKKNGRVPPCLVNRKTKQPVTNADSDGDSAPPLDLSNPSLIFKPGKRTITYLRVLPETQAQVTRWEMNRTSPRFGLPVTYLCTVNSPWDGNNYGVAGAPQVSLNVHWTRIVHITDNRQAHPVLGRPRMQPVLNNLLNLDKIFGAGAEGYWKSCFTGLSIETHPQLGGNVKVNRQELMNTVENYDNSLTRTLYLMGMTAKTLAPAVVDPTPHITANEGAICVQLAMPLRVWKGSERGELASSEDDGKWNDVLRTYQRVHVTPDVIVPFVDRLILVGVLPEPEEFHVDWPDLESQTDQEKATFALTVAQALTAYLQCKEVMTEEDFYVECLKFPEALAKRIVRRAAKAQEDEMDENQALADKHGMVPSAPEGFEQPPPEPPPPSPIKVKPNEKIVTPKPGLGGKPTPLPKDDKPPAPE